MKFGGGLEGWEQKGWEGREQGRAGSSLSTRLMCSCQGRTLNSIWQIVYCSLFLLWALAGLPKGPGPPACPACPGHLFT